MLRGYAAARPAVRRGCYADDAAGAHALRRHAVPDAALDAARHNRLRATVTEAVFAGERCRYLCLRAAEGRRLC